MELAAFVAGTVIGALVGFILGFVIGAKFSYRYLKRAGQLVELPGPTKVSR